MLHFLNTLPSFAKMLIGFHDIYRRMWKNIDPWGMVITRFKAKSQFKLDWTGTKLELSLAKKQFRNLFLSSRNIKQIQKVHFLRRPVYKSCFTLMYNFTINSTFIYIIDLAFNYILKFYFTLMYNFIFVPLFIYINRFDIQSNIQIWFYFNVQFHI